MILGITPVRGGSKGIPRKNIKVVGGRPLIKWTIDSASKSKLLDRYIVSTEDDEIARLSMKYDVEVLRRPIELAFDETDTVDVLRHAIECIPCDVVVLLQATSPVREAGLIDDCIKEFLEGGYDSLATGFVCKYVEYGKTILRRQDIEGFFYDDGNVYVLRPEIIKKGYLFGGKICRKIISRRQNVEIDDEFDLWLAERILREEKL